VNTHPEANEVLEKAILAFSGAQTLYYEGARSHPNGVTHQKYWFSSDGGAARIRVESSATVSGMQVSTTFLKDGAGIWDIHPDRAIEVSGVFGSDNLLGVYPFFRFFASRQHPYELESSGEDLNGVQHLVVNGKLSAVPDANAPDIAKEFTYRIAKGSGLLYSIRELTFAKRSLDLRLDKLELNQPLDPGFFELPSGTPKVTATSIKQYTDLKSESMARKMLES
jgi:hypothetical protein